MATGAPGPRGWKVARVDASARPGLVSATTLHPTDVAQHALEDLTIVLWRSYNPALANRQGTPCGRSGLAAPPLVAVANRHVREDVRNTQ